MSLKVILYETASSQHSTLLNTFLENLQSNSQQKRPTETVGQTSQVKQPIAKQGLTVMAI